MSRIYVIALSLSFVGFSACSVNSNVSFRDGFHGGVTESAPPAPGLGATNGGFMHKTTSQGNTASLSMGMQVNSVSGTTANGNRFKLNVSGQTAQ
jgi:hypothetical protein